MMTSNNEASHHDDDRKRYVSVVEITEDAQQQHKKTKTTLEVTRDLLQHATLDSKTKARDLLHQVALDSKATRDNDNKISELQIENDTLKVSLQEAKEEIVKLKEENQELIAAAAGNGTLATTAADNETSASTSLGSSISPSMDDEEEDGGLPTTVADNNKEGFVLKVAAVATAVAAGNGTAAAAAVAPLGPSLPKTTAIQSLTIPLRIMILNYLGQTQEELINLTLVSKYFNEDCKRPGIIWNIIPTIEISPTKGGSTLALFQQFCTHFSNNETNKKLRRYRHMKVNDVHKFDLFPYNEIQEVTKDVRMDWILSLDMSLSTPTRINNILSHSLSDILPNLSEIDLSNTCAINDTLVIIFSKRCHHLVKVTWNNIKKDSYVELNGNDMHFSNTSNLKEIIMDDSVFYCEYAQTMCHGEDDDDDDEDFTRRFIFHRCCETLERVSIRNAKWFLDRTNITRVIPQNALIKFVRLAPHTLRWFRSDLTQKNINMLRLERPDIELIN